MRIGSDTGGTFTDLVDERGRVAKVLSTPQAPAEALRDGIAALRARRVALLAHGTTVATNALLEGQLATTALVTTAGFADVIEIARQDRPRLYDHHADRPVPLVDRAHRLEVEERLAADGSELEPVGDLPEVPEATVAVAVCLLHADLDPAHEVEVAEALRAAGHEVSASHEVSPEFREYERTVTTVVNAGLGPVCRAHLEELAPLAERVLVMTSAGGLTPVSAAARTPAGLLLSGPAGGVRAGATYAALAGYPDAVTFDMGGTSTDVALVLAGEPQPAADSTPARGGTTTAAMPSASASAHACNGPAPPKATSARPAGSTPRSTETRRTARSMRASTTSSTSSAADSASPMPRPTSAFAAASTSSVPSASNPTAAGMRPATRLASVTVGSVPPVP